MERQKERITLLEKMIKSFDEGRSRSFYCLAAALLSIEDLKASLNEAEQRIKADGIRLEDVKAKSKILKEILNRFAAKEGIELKLRRKA